MNYQQEAKQQEAERYRQEEAKRQAAARYQEEVKRQEAERYQQEAKQQAGIRYHQEAVKKEPEKYYQKPVPKDKEREILEIMAAKAEAEEKAAKKKAKSKIIQPQEEITDLDWKNYLPKSKQKARPDIILNRLIKADAPAEVIAEYMRQYPSSYQAVGMKGKVASIIEKVQVIEAQKSEKAKEKFEAENINIKGTWLNRKEIDQLRRDDPYLWSVLNTDGYQSYLKAIRERKSKLGEIEIRSKEKFESLLKEQPDEFQKAYEKGGYDAYKQAVDAYNTKIDKEKAEFEKWLNKEAPEELKAAYFGAKARGGDEIESYNNAVRAYNEAAEIYKGLLESENSKRQSIINDLKPYRLSIKELESPTVNWMYFSTGGKAAYNYDIAKYLRNNEGNKEAEANLLLIFDQKQIDDAKKYNYEYLGIGAPEHITWQEYWPDYFKEKGWPTKGIKDTNQFMNRLAESHKEYDKKYAAPMTLEQFERNYFTEKGWKIFTQMEEIMEAEAGGSLGKMSRDKALHKLEARNEYAKKFGWEPIVIQSLDNISNAMVPGYYVSTNWNKISVPEKVVNIIFDVVFLASFFSKPISAGAKYLKGASKSTLDNYLKIQKNSVNIALKEIGSSLEGVLRTFGAELDYAKSFKTSYDKLLYAIERNDMGLFKEAAKEITKLTSNNLSPKIQKLIKQGGEYIANNAKTYEDLIEKTREIKKSDIVTDKAVAESLENTKVVWQKNIKYSSQQFKETIDNLVGFYKKLRQQELEFIQRRAQEQTRKMIERNKKIFERMTQAEKDALIESKTGKPEGHFKGKKELKEKTVEFEKEWKSRESQKRDMYEKIEKQKAEQELKKWRNLTQAEQDAYLERITKMEPGEFAKRKKLRDLLKKEKEWKENREKLIQEIKAEKYEGELRTWRQMTNAQQDALLEKLTKMEPGEFNRRKLLREFIQQEKKAKANYNKILDEIGKEKYEGEIRTWRQMTTAEKDAALEKLLGKEPGYFNKKKAALKWREELKGEELKRELAYKKAMDEKLEGERRKIEQLTKKEKDAIIENHEKIRRDIEKAKSEAEIRNTIDDIENMLRGKRNITPEEQLILDDIDEYLKGTEGKAKPPSKGGVAVKEKAKKKVKIKQTEKAKEAKREKYKLEEKPPETVTRIKPEVLTIIGIPIKGLPSKAEFIMPYSELMKSPLFIARERELPEISELKSPQKIKIKQIVKSPETFKSKKVEEERKYKYELKPKEEIGKKPTKGEIKLKITPKEEPETKPFPEELPELPKPPELKKVREKKKAKIPPASDEQKKKRKEIKESLGAATYRRGKLQNSVWHTYYVDKGGELNRTVIQGPPPEGAMDVTGKGSATITLKRIRGKRLPNFTVIADTGAVDDIITASGGKLTLSHVPDRISGGGMKRITNGIGRLSPKTPRLR